MRYGVCSWIFGDTPLLRVAELLSGLGYDGIELFANWKRYPARATQHVLSEHGLSVFSLTPDSVDLAHPEDDIRAKARNYYLRLLDYASELGSPLIGCHGAVGRLRAISGQAEEERLLAEEVSLISARAEELGLRIALEGLNHYESHLLNTAAQMQSFVDEVGASKVGILLDTYHMNIEEEDLVGAIKTAGKKLFLFHVADSNRRAVGRGHIPFSDILRGLEQANYSRPIIVECTAPGPDPFAVMKGPGWYEQTVNEVQKSISELHRLEGASQGK